MVITAIGYHLVGLPSCQVLGVLCCQGNSPQYPYTVSQRWRHDIAVDLVENLRRLHIAVEELLDLRPNQWKQLRLVHHATADDDALGRECADEIDQRQRQVMRLQNPGNVIRPNVCAGWPQRFARAGPDASPSKQSP
jgi:hypothetical protein